jgi:hypothetical protein
MKEWFEIKAIAKLGPEDKDDKEVTILGRTVRWKNWGIEYEADVKHRNIVMEHFGFNEKTHGLTGNGNAEIHDEEDENDEKLVGGEVTSFRAVAARINFLAQDCPDLQFPAKEVCREMSSPTLRSWNKLKRLARYLVHRRVAVYRFEWQEEGYPMTLYTDSDWAGCRRTRKSTSGGSIMIGRHCIKKWSRLKGLWH